MDSSVTVVQPTGIFDGTQIGDFHQKIADAVKTGASTILVNLADVSFMDSSGLGALVSAHKTVRSTGKRFCVCSINEQIRILFELTSIDRVLDIFANQDEFRQVARSNS